MRSSLGGRILHNKDIPLYLERNALCNSEEKSSCSVLWSMHTLQGVLWKNQTAFKFSNSSWLFNQECLLCSSGLVATEFWGFYLLIIGWCIITSSFVQREHKIFKIMWNSKSSGEMCFSQHVTTEITLLYPWDFQEYCSGLPFPPLRDLPNLGIKPTSPTSPVLAGGFCTTRTQQLGSLKDCRNIILICYSLLNISHLLTNLSTLNIVEEVSNPLESVPEIL